MNKSYINEQELQSFYRDFNNKALDLLGEYNTMEYALDDGASYIKGDTQAAVTDASEKVATTKKRIEDILLRYNECMSNSIESMAGLDAGAVSKMKGELANLSEGAKKRSGSGGGSNGGSSGGGSNGGSSGGGNETGGGSNGGNGSGSNGNNQTDQNNNEAKKPYKPSNDYYKNPDPDPRPKPKPDPDPRPKPKPDPDPRPKPKPDPDPRPKPDPSNNAELEARIKALQEKMRQLQEELSKKRYTDPTPPSRPDPTPVPNPIPGPIRTPDFTPTNGDTPSTGTNFKNPTDNNVGTGSELGTTTNDKDSLEKMSTGTEAETPNLEDGEVIEEGNLTDVSPTDLSDENLELGATDDTLVSEDKSGSNNLLKFAGIGGMLLGSGALAAGLATKKDEEELSAEETTEEASDELEDEYSQELKDFYE